MPDYQALNTQVRKHKSALTRSKKKGPEAVLKAVEAAYADFDRFGPWPDNWYLWEMAKNDAEHQIRSTQWTRTTT